MNIQYRFDWADLAFSSKKPLTELSATFIPAPRGISEARFRQLVKDLLPNGNIILGIAKEDFIDGFAGQPQFATLQSETVTKIIDKVNQSPSKYKIYCLLHFQRETNFISEKIKPKRVVLIRGSWLYAFHTTSLYYTLAKFDVPYEIVSPFEDEDEAKSYSNEIGGRLKKSAEQRIRGQKNLSDTAVFELLTSVAGVSFDYNFQTGLILAKKQGSTYTVIDYAHNIIVPYETYALHHGASREVNFSPPQDLNHYDTVHAEVSIALQAMQEKRTLDGLSVFINLLPCPPCSRLLSQTGISELVYSLDHSDGYGLKLLESSGKTVRRVII